MSEWNKKVIKGGRMSFILNNCMAISIVFVVILFVSIAFNRRIASLVISFLTVLFGLFLLLYSFF